MYTAEYNKITGILTIKHKQDGNTSTMCFKTNEVKRFIEKNYSEDLEGLITIMNDSDFKTGFTIHWDEIIENITLNEEILKQLIEKR